MAGVVGIVQGDGTRVSASLLDRLTRSLAFRGPDGQSVWMRDGVGLGHSCLLASSRTGRDDQPCSLDGRVWITADVRLDGRSELRATLDAYGREGIEDATDAELILHAYGVWGDDCLQHLLGDFAFGLWDESRQRLLCAVDRFRVRLLYYSNSGADFAFSNTLETLRLLPNVSDALNDVAVGDFLLFTRYQDPDVTIYRDIHRLPPAHFLIWKDGSIRVSRYWSVPEGDPYAEPRADQLEEFDHLMEKAVADRLIGERVGVGMSGGIDSPMLAAMAKRIIASPRRGSNTTAIQAFTLVMDHLIPDEERYYSSVAARAMDISQTIVPCDDFEPFGRPGVREWPAPEPTQDPWRFLFSAYAKLISDTCSLCILGIDGDTMLRTTLSLHWKGLLRTGRVSRLVRDLFWYVASQRRLPPLGLRALLRRRRRRLVRTSLPPWLNSEFARRMDLAGRWEEFNELGPDEWPRGFRVSRGESPPGPRSRTQTAFDLPRWTFAFDRYDAGWTGSHLEFSHPFMDVRVAQFLLTLPSVPWCVNKEMYRRWLRPILPREITARRKTPFLAEPFPRRVSQVGCWWAKELDWHAETGYYVEINTLERNSDGSYRIPAGPDALYEWLRPFNLNDWLVHRE